jgi:deferrochelatase/peroxidase EfeB
MSDYHATDSTEPKKAKYINDFGYRDKVCPVAAHIRKTNLREVLDPNDQDPRAYKTRMIRNGIPYGTDYKGHENDPPRRGLLFACYQGHIEDGFQNMQRHWANNPEFRYAQAGLDPIIGQPEKDKNGEMVTYITNATNTKTTELKFQQLVTLKGGEYLFVPSMAALSGILAGAT